MTTAVLDAKTADYDIADVEYLRHGDKPLLARVFTPRGQGPFPALVECHGGAWCMSDRLDRAFAPRIYGRARHRLDRARFPLRQRGAVSGFGGRHQLRGALGQAPRPRLKTRPELIGLSGQSSGGHLAMLVAMRSHDPRYAAIALPAGSHRHDAVVRAVVLSWPVINPLSRYRHAKRALASGAATGPKASSRATTRTGARRTPWRRAIRCSPSSAARKF